MRPITGIVIHCAGSPDGRPLAVAEVDRWHEARGFRRRPQWLAQQAPELAHIGYHFFIGVDGVVALGRHIDEAGAHVQGSNAWSIGICLAGSRRFTLDQWVALRQVVTGLQNRYQAAIVKGHRDYSPDLDGDGVIERHEWLKECPGFDVAAWRKAEMLPDWDVEHLVDALPA
jgi:N-acetylmuramoyl-L-alanine amidase